MGTKREPRDRRQECPHHAVQSPTFVWGLDDYLNSCPAPHRYERRDTCTSLFTSLLCKVADNLKRISDLTFLWLIIYINIGPHMKMHPGKKKTQNLKWLKRHSLSSFISWSPLKSFTFFVAFQAKMERAKQRESKNTATTYKRNGKFPCKYYLRLIL